MRSCFVCLRVDLLHTMSSIFDDFELVQNLHFIADISVVELKDAPALLICKTCKKLSTICADFKKRCIRADNNSKRNSTERFLWSENLSKLKVYQPVEDETTTIETIIETPVLQENEMVILQQIEEAPLMIEDPLNVENNQIIERNIDKLSCQQIKELTEEISNLLNIDFHENEQFRFIRTRLTRNSSTTAKSNTKISTDNSTNQFSCTKCALKFSDAQQLSLHFARIHIYRSKRNSL